MNSVYVLSAFIGFVALGYLSLVRLLYKHEQQGQPSPAKSLATLFISPHLFITLANSAIFLWLPTASFLLFWGWGPALLWLAVAHLLVETPANFISVKMQRQFNVASHFADYDSFGGSLRALLMHSLLVCLTALLLASLANLIDQQTGLLFALACVFISIRLLKSADSTIDAILKLAASITILAMGLILAQTMGIAVFGQWAPLDGQFAWLRFDNRTILALMLLLGATWLNQSELLYQGAIRLTGRLVALLVVLSVSLMVWQQPLLDAPTISAAVTVENETHALPSFLSLFLFIGAPMLILLTRLVGYGSAFDHSQDESETHELQTLQLAGFIALLLGLSVVLWLATATGIGAWNTHYTNWPEAVTVQAHLGLAIQSLSAALASKSEFTGTLLVIGFCLFVVTCMLFLVNTLHRQAVAAEAAGQEKQTIFTLVLSKFSLQVGLAYILCAWFLSQGMRVELWLWVMAATWLLSCDVLLEYASELETPDFHDHFRRAFALGLFGIGALQTLWTMMSNFISGNLWHAGAYMLILMLAGLLCLRNAVNVAKSLQLKGETKLFNG